MFRVYGGPGGFTSKHLTQDELIGLALFNSDSATQLGVEDQVPIGTTNGGMCYLCHLTTPHTVDADYNPDNGPDATVTYNPLLTDFTFDNLGIPVNPRITELAGPQPIDYGLGAQVDQLEAAFPEISVPEDFPDGLGGLISVVPEEIEKFKVCL